MRRTVSTIATTFLLAAGLGVAPGLAQAGTTYQPCLNGCAAIEHSEAVWDCAVHLGSVGWRLNNNWTLNVIYRQGKTAVVDARAFGSHIEYCWESQLSYAVKVVDSP